LVLRIRLVELRPAGHNVYDFSLLPRLGLPLIGRMLADSGHDVHVFCELLAPVDLQECFDADLVGISTTTSTAPAAYRLADTLAEAGVPVVLGGPHVTFCTDDALEHAPYVVRGEGERTMTELVARLPMRRRASAPLRPTGATSPGSDPTRSNWTAGSSPASTPTRSNKPWCKPPPRHRDGPPGPPDRPAGPADRGAVRWAGQSHPATVPGAGRGVDGTG